MIIEVGDLVFDYPQKRALQDVSFQIAEGTITAVVGPNGAGKTTLLRCLAGLDRPTAGTIRLDGIDVLAAPRAARRRIGFLQDFFGIYDGLSVARCLEYWARAHAVPEPERSSRIAWAAQAVGLADRHEQRASTLSRGLRQRLAIAQTIMHQPAVLLLDEPAAGLDPEARAELSALFRKLRSEGHTLLVSSHILAELEDYSTHMLIVEDGRVIRHATLDNAALDTGRQRIEIRFSAAVSLEALRSVVAELSMKDPTTVVADLAEGDGPRLQLLRTILDAGLPLLAFAPEQTNLSRYYLDHVAADRSARQREKAT